MKALWSAWSILLVSLFGAAAAHADPITLDPLEPVVRCEALKGVSLEAVTGAATRISSANTVAGSHGYCQIRGTIAPAVGFEVRLPLSHWTQRFIQAGCGGLCGHIDIRLDNAGGCVPLQNGEVALASTDMGHADGGMDGAWGREDYQARVDFAYRGVHVTALAAKALIAHFYGKPPRFSYFAGCSDGGREALMEAQRYPDDFNGIIAGAPALNFTTQNSFYHGWNALTNRRADGSYILTAERLSILHQAVLAQCDAQDGLKDGLISDPQRCHPQLAPVTCRAGQPNDACLTPDEVRVALAIYQGAHDASGRGLVIGGPLPGSELGWAGVFVPRLGQHETMSLMISEGTLRNVSSNPNVPADFKIEQLRFDEAGFKTTTSLHGLFDATDSDLSRYFQSGGRLILWHGLADPHISPMNTVAYFEAVKRRMGTAAMQKSARLYLFPGGDHCGGGDGPFDVDLMSAIMAWVERDIPPNALLASHSTRPRGPPPGPPGDGQKGGAAAVAEHPAAPSDRTRPVYPYPQVSRYVGRGSIDDAANFVPAAGTPWQVNERWYGARFFDRSEHLWCAGKQGSLDCRDSPGP